MFRDYQEQTTPNWQNIRTLDQRQKLTAVCFVFDQYIFVYFEDKLSLIAEL